MARRQRTGLDELMIVNPGSPASTRAVVLRRPPSADQPPQATADVQPAGHQRGKGAKARSRARGRFFLGADGALYEVIE